MNSYSKMILVETKDNYEFYDKDKNFTMKDLYELSNQFYMKIFRNKYYFMNKDLNTAKDILIYCGATLKETKSIAEYDKIINGNTDTTN